MSQIVLEFRSVAWRFLLAFQVKAIRWVRSSGLVTGGILLGFFIGQLLGIVPYISFVDAINVSLPNWGALALLAMCYELVVEWFFKRGQAFMAAYVRMNLVYSFAEGIWLMLGLYFLASVMVFASSQPEPILYATVPMAMLILTSSISVIRAATLRFVDLILSTP